MSKMGVARAGRGRSVAVDVDPNVQKKIEFLKFKGRAYPLLGLLRNMKARAGQEILRAAICRV